MTDQNQLNKGQKLLKQLRSEVVGMQQIEAENQEMLNRPTQMQDRDHLDPQDDDFLKLIINLVEQKKIDLYRPASLLNSQVYDKLPESGKAKADYDILNLLNKIREINRLWLSGDHNSYQIYNLVHSLRQSKERLEELGGDVFII